MPSYEPDDSAQRVSRYRRHQAGDHSLCLYANCRPRQQLEYDNDAHLLAVAVFDELEQTGVDAREFFGDGYDDARRLADAEFPDYDYLPNEPDCVVRIQARSAIAGN